MVIVYAGTPDFAVPALQALCQQQALQPQLVLTQPDRPAGRGQQLQTSPVKQFASSRQLPLLQPESLRDADTRQQLAALAPDLIIVAAYGLLLPPDILNLPQHGCWNIHASLLPRWRGAAPIQQAIAAGDSHTGISIMQMQRGLDTGPVYLQRQLAIAADDTSGSLHDRLARLGAECLLQCISALQQGELPAPVAQDDTLATYAPRLRKSDARIDWHEPAEVIARKIRAYNPWPAAWTELLGRRTIIWQAQAMPGNYGSAGSIIQACRDRLLIACGNGAVAIHTLQPAGGRRMPVVDWLNAHGNKLKTPA